MIADTRVSMTPEELAAFAQKLEGFATTLEPKERSFLEQMLADASDAANQDPSGYANVSTALEEDDVSGYSMGMPGTGAVFGSIMGYADGIERDESDALEDTSAVK